MRNDSRELLLNELIVQIKDGWGWCKWDVETWSECRMPDTAGELLEERCVHFATHY